MLLLLLFLSSAVAFPNESRHDGGGAETGTKFSGSRLNINDNNNNKLQPSAMRLLRATPALERVELCFVSVRLRPASAEIDESPIGSCAI